MWDILKLRGFFISDQSNHCCRILLLLRRLFPQGPSLHIIDHGPFRALTTRSLPQALGYIRPLSRESGTDPQPPLGSYSRNEFDARALVVFRIFTGPLRSRTQAPCRAAAHTTTEGRLPMPTML